MSIFVLAFIFFCIALIYASVGFGGGSSYIAILAFLAFDAATIKSTALICNIIVVLGGTYIFWKNSTLDLKKVLFISFSSVPMAYLGASMRMSDKTYFLLLGISLLLASLFLFALTLSFLTTKNIDNQVFRNNKLTDIFLGGSIGFLSGAVGIGGGIFLAPILHFLHWDKTEKIAATASFFILINSLVGLVAFFTTSKQNIDYQFITPLIVAVFLGGQLGTRLNLNLFNPNIIKRITAILVMIAGAEIIFKTIVKM
jgi:hypothetical protein